ATQADDGLGRKVHVVGQVPGKVVGAELVFGVKALGFQIFGPLRELFPVAPGEIGVAIHLGDGGHEDKQVPAFLNRHLVFFRALSAAVHLSIGVGIGA